MDKNKCILCGSENFQQKLMEENQDSPETYQISEKNIHKPNCLYKCCNCGLVFVSQSSADVEKLYAEAEDDIYLAEEAGRRKAARKVIKRIKRYKRSGRLLEIGCSAGLFIDEARKAGFSAEGVELSDWAVNHAREKFGLTVFHGALELASFADQSFDVIVLLDVIEHLIDPKQLLLTARRLLKNNGIIYISTPNIDSFVARRMKSKWWGINFFHLFYFSRTTLSQLLESVNYVPKKVYSHTRYFSIHYLLEHLEKYSGWLNHVIRRIVGLAKLHKCLFPVNFYDQVDIIATKKRMLSDFDDDQIQSEFREIDLNAKVIVVLPAYKAEKTLPITIRDIPKDVVDEIILVDDCSPDRTVEVAKELGLTVIEHQHNRGYGGNQKTCYEAALAHGADIVVMVHPDYQYDPKVIPEMIKPIQMGIADACFGSRMMKGGALEGGMPKWKHNANILLTAFENVVLGIYLTEYHTGFRAYSADLLRSLNLEADSDGFVFDTEIIVQAVMKGAKIEEVPIRTRYFDEASKIKFWPSAKYGLGILWTMFKYILHTKTFIHFKQFR